MPSSKKKKGLTTFRVISLGFFLIIFLGALLLTCPFSSADGQWTNFGDALFTATSATCVTGLVVENTATHWSNFGQLIILCMIQIGGMGVITVAVFFSALLGKKIGVGQRLLMQDSISAPRVGGIINMTRFIVILTLCIELLGAALLFPVFLQDYHWLKALWYSLFHSISAFCNAGFDLLGETTHYISLVNYYDSPWLLLTVALLIIAGGLGFFTWSDIREHKLHINKYSMQTKVILTTTGLLILLPWMYFLFIEFQGSQWDYMTLPEKVINSFFQAVTPRTAGFNSIDLTQLMESGQFITLLLMLIGGAPGSTAGGMKVTTFAVLIIITYSVFKRKKDATCFGRQLNEDRARYAVTVLMMYLSLLFMGTLIISIVEDFPLLTALFECGSAVGTVGLSLGITPDLSLVSRIVLIILMFFGRVGGLTLIFSAVNSSPIGQAKLPQEKITLG